MELLNEALNEESCFQDESAEGIDMGNDEDSRIQYLYPETEEQQLERIKLFFEVEFSRPEWESSGNVERKWFIRKLYPSEDTSDDYKTAEEICSTKSFDGIKEKEDEGEEGEGNSSDVKQNGRKKSGRLRGTKVHIRHLPKTMTQEELLEVLGPLPPNNYIHFLSGKFMSTTMDKHSTGFCYINFCTAEDANRFVREYAYFVLINERGQEFGANCQFATNQRIPKVRRKEFEKKLHDYEFDENFIAFRDSYNNDLILEGCSKTSVEVMMKEIDERKERFHTQTSPLVEFITAGKGKPIFSNPRFMLVTKNRNSEQEPTKLQPSEVTESHRTSPVVSKITECHTTSMQESIPLPLVMAPNVSSKGMNLYPGVPLFVPPYSSPPLLPLPYPPPSVPVVYQPVAFPCLYSYYYAQSFWRTPIYPYPFLNLNHCRNFNTMNHRVVVPKKAANPFSDVAVSSEQTAETSRQTASRSSLLIEKIQKQDTKCGGGLHTRNSRADKFGEKEDKQLSPRKAEVGIIRTAPQPLPVKEIEKKNIIPLMGWKFKSKTPRRSKNPMDKISMTDIFYENIPTKAYIPNSIVMFSDRATISTKNLPLITETPQAPVQVQNLSKTSDVASNVATLLEEKHKYQESVPKKENKVPYAGSGSFESQQPSTAVVKEDAKSRPHYGFRSPAQNFVHIFTESNVSDPDKKIPNVRRKSSARTNEHVKRLPDKSTSEINIPSTIPHVKQSSLRKPRVFRSTTRRKQQLEYSLKVDSKDSKKPITDSEMSSIQKLQDIPKLLAAFPSTKSSETVAVSQFKSLHKDSQYHSSHKSKEQQQIRPLLSIYIPPPRVIARKSGVGAVSQNKCKQ